MCLKIEMQNSFTQFSATEQRLEPYARRTYTRREHISRCVSCDAKMRQEAPVVNKKNDANLRQRTVPPTTLCTEDCSYSSSVLNVFRFSFLGFLEN